ncbi:MAG: virulence protein RhuM/Fic/DOC family protein [Candidatus Magasanikbacteria bacterium]|nr:virulence protein RhuM/Fic/DOC family protein [Candidatus Magasanikbacteria bacterium]
MKKEKNEQKGEVVIYKAPKGEARVEVRLEKETVWLDAHQIAFIFEVDRSVIVKHIKGVYEQGELAEKSTCAKIAQVAADGKIRQMHIYNLDVIISVGYRVNSQCATQFRVWATQTLKKHLIQGYTINAKRLMEARDKFNELQNIISLYDTGKLAKPKGVKAKFVLKYEDCVKIIKEIKTELVSKKEAGDLFGSARGGAFEGIVKNLCQTFGGKELYATLEEKAAHLLYFTVKDHSFSDGNKRIGSFLFVYFLDKNNCLYKESGEKKINDNTLVALALLIAESDPKEKNVLIKIVMNLIKS